MPFPRDCRDGQPGIVPGHLPGGILPSNILLPRPERPQLHDRHRGVKPWGMVIPPGEPDLVACDVSGETLVEELLFRFAEWPLRLPQ